MTAVQTAINTLASAAAALGSSQNQIQALSNNVTVAQQNLTSAHADLVDVNVAAGDLAVHFPADPRAVRHLGPVPGPTAPATGPQADLTAQAEDK